MKAALIILIFFSLTNQAHAGEPVIGDLSVHQERLNTISAEIGALDIQVGELERGDLDYILSMSSDELENLKYEMGWVK